MAQVQVQTTKSGVIIYSGPSQIDGAPIVGIVTNIYRRTKNSKIGQNTAQLWIMRADINPIEAIRTHADYAVCGACPHRSPEVGTLAGRTCYVQTRNIQAIYKAYKAGYTPEGTPADVNSELHARGRVLRLGAYGDPAALPIDVIETLAQGIRTLGYTHQWKICNPAYARYCMASCDSIQESAQAIEAGYRPFFVVKTELDRFWIEHAALKFVNCPASKEAGNLTTCDKCQACAGTRRGQKSLIYINLH